MQMICLGQSYKKCLKILVINLVGELGKCALERELKWSRYVSEYPKSATSYFNVCISILEEIMKF